YTEDSPLQARSPYDVSKAAADLLAQSYHASYGLPVAILRGGNTYGGADLKWSRLVPGTIGSFHQREAPQIRSAGTFLRGEIYFSTVYAGVVKGWHLHDRMTINYAVPVGAIKLVLFDDRDGSATRGELQELFLGESNYALVTVPPKVWNGFKGVAAPYSVV